MRFTLLISQTVKKFYDYSAEYATKMENTFFRYKNEQFL